MVIREYMTWTNKLMKVLKKWFRGEGESPDGTQHGPTGPAADYAKPDTPEDDAEDTSFNWRAMESTSSNVFDSPDTHRLRVLKSARVRPANDDDNPGYDPYDTGRFNNDK